MTKPSIVVVMGKTATGKTTAAKQLSRSLGYHYVSSSEVRETIKPGFTAVDCACEELREKTYTEIMEIVNNKLFLGKSCVVDASYHKKRRRIELYESISGLVEKITVIECRCEDQGLINERVHDRKKDKEGVHNRAHSIAITDHIEDGYQELGAQEREDYGLIIFINDTTQTQKNQILMIKEGSNSGLG